jgi:hypothetical protein
MGNLPFKGLLQQPDNDQDQGNHKQYMDKIARASKRNGPYVAEQPQD